MVDVYQYSYEILKCMLKDVLKPIQNDLLYSKKVVIPGNNDRRTHYMNATNAANGTNENLTDRIAKLQYVYEFL